MEHVDNSTRLVRIDDIHDLYELEISTHEPDLSGS